MKHNEVILHGEAMIYPSPLPNDVEEIKPSNDTFHIIADSETTGNHHVIDRNSGTKFFRSRSTGAMFMENTKPTKVRCLHKERHNPIGIEPGTYSIGESQQEYDHFEKNLRNVRD
jgi:hypothetical protein